MAISLGSFQVSSRIASGGMGDVWSGVHAPSRLPVAVKVVRRDRVGGSAEADLEREIRFQARLDHPGVVYLFDHGRLDAEAAAGMELPEGSPWVAMEWCSSNLYEVGAGLGWDGVRSALAQLLDALAHAHASGVLHRDIKLANVLVATASDLRPGVKLADFGIAHVLQDDDEDTRSVGTPRYMAPEQVMGDWEQHGPWTDLYALGVLAWRLVTGKRPWADVQGAKLALAMVHHPLGWPGARIPVPKEFPAWIERMTAKAPPQRYQLAADALEALLAFPDPDGRRARARGDATMLTLVPPHEQEDELPARGAVSRPVEDPPPETEATIRLHAAGLGLLPLRRVPMLGRTEQRRIAWGLLREASQTRAPRGLAVTGPARVGRTRFLEWLGETAERTGHGVPLVVRCDRGRPLAEAVILALRGWFRVGALKGHAAREHLRTWVGDAPFVRELQALLHRGRAADRTWIGVVAATLEALARVRPVVLRVDGATASELEELVPAVLRVNGPVLLTTDTVVDGLTELKLGPLEDAALHRLASSMVGLDPDVRARLVARSAGSPGFLVLTLAHWASQGRLTEGPNGYKVDGGDDLAPSLAVVATSRWVSVLSVLPEGGRDALECAAVLGPVVDRTLWAAVDGPDRDLLRARVEEVLAERGLAEDVDGGWRFTSAPLREAVLTSAGARRIAHHARCADVLAAWDRPEHALSLGHHRLAAGDVLGALEPLRRGVERSALLVGSAVGLSALADLERAVERLQGPSRLRWGAVVLELASGMHHEAGDEERAEREARDALRTAEVFGDVDLAARSWARLGAVAGRRRDERGRADALDRALQLGAGLPGSLRARWWMELGRSRQALGDESAWVQCTAEAGRCAASDPDPSVAHFPALGAAARAWAARDAGATLTALDEAALEAARAGNATGHLVALRSRGQVLVDSDRPSEAREALVGALELAVALRAPGAPQIVGAVIACDLTLGESAVGMERFDHHRWLLPPARDGAATLTPLHAAAVAVCALRGDWSALTHHLERVRRHGQWSPGTRWSNDVCLRAAADAARARGKRLLGAELDALREQQFG